PPRGPGGPRTPRWTGGTASPPDATLGPWLTLRRDLHHGRWHPAKGASSAIDIVSRTGGNVSRRTRPAETSHDGTRRRSTASPSLRARLRLRRAPRARRPPPLGRAQVPRGPPRRTHRRSAARPGAQRAVLPVRRGGGPRSRGAARRPPLPGRPGTRRSG